MVIIKPETALVLREIVKESIQQLQDITDELNEEETNLTRTALESILNDLTRGLIKADVI